MKRLLSGRHVDLSGIDIKEVIDWIKSDNHAKGIIKCQLFIALNNGNKHAGCLCCFWCNS
jgi:hypothetical protein